MNTYRSKTEQNLFTVASFTRPNDKYQVRLHVDDMPGLAGARCNCPHCEAGKHTCKHIVQLFTRLAAVMPLRIRRPAGAIYRYIPEDAYYLTEEHHSDGIITAWQAMGYGDSEVLEGPIDETMFFLSMLGSPSEVYTRQNVIYSVSGNVIAIGDMSKTKFYLDKTLKDRVKWCNPALNRKPFDARNTLYKG